MSKSINTTTVIESELEKTPEVSREFAINAMRRPILMRAISGSRRAINKDEALDGGCSASAFSQWKSDIEDLYDSAVDFYESLSSDDQKTIDDAEAECLKVWKRILRAGEETPLQPRMYVRDTDAHNMRVWACESETRVVNGIGTVGVYTGLDKFRGIIETRIALRIAGNAILKDEDREILDAYDKAEKSIKSAEQILNGYQQGKTVVPSIDAQIKDAQDTLDKIVEALTFAGTPADTITELTKRQKQLVSDLKETKDSAEKKLAKWTKVRDANEDAYNEIKADLDKIEGFLDSEPSPQETAEQSKARHAAEAEKRRARRAK